LAAERYADAQATAAIIRRKNHDHPDVAEEDNEVFTQLSRLSDAELTKTARDILHQWTIRDSGVCSGPADLEN
jgi:hypothetical protein